MKWFYCADELPPCDGEYLCRSLIDDKDYYIAEYDGLGFLWRGMRCFPCFWTYKVFPEKRYGKQVN